MCRLYGVSPAGFYAWKQRSPSERSIRDEALTQKIQRARAASKETYGSALPPDTSAFVSAQPGWYVLRETGERVENPGFTATWNVVRNDAATAHYSTRSHR